MRRRRPAPLSPAGRPRFAAPASWPAAASGACRGRSYAAGSAATAAGAACRRAEASARRVAAPPTQGCGSTGGLHDAGASPRPAAGSSGRGDSCSSGLLGAPSGSGRARLRGPRGCSMPLHGPAPPGSPTARRRLAPRHGALPAPAPPLPLPPPRRAVGPDLRPATAPAGHMAPAAPCGSPESQSTNELRRASAAGHSAPPCRARASGADHTAPGRAAGAAAPASGSPTGASAGGRHACHTRHAAARTAASTGPQSANSTRVLPGSSAASYRPGGHAMKSRKAGWRRAAGAGAARCAPGAGAACARCQAWSAAWNRARSSLAAGPPCTGRPFTNLPPRVQARGAPAGIHAGPHQDVERQLLCANTSSCSASAQDA